MQAMKHGPAVPAWLAAGLVGLVLGGVGGFYGQTWMTKPALAGPPGAAGGGPGGAGRGGFGGGMGGGQQHPNAMSLVRAVGALDTLEKARSKELTEEQRGKLKPMLASLAGDQTLTEDQCRARLSELTAVLNPDQQALLEEMTARPGGRGGGGGMGAPGGGGPGGNGPAANGPGGRAMPTPMPMGGMGGGQQPNLDKLFAEGRGKERLDSLLRQLGK